MRQVVEESGLVQPPWSIGKMVSRYNGKVINGVAVRIDRSERKVLVFLHNDRVVAPAKGSPNITATLSPVATHGLIVKRNLEREWRHRLREDSAEVKHATKIGNSAKTRQNPSTPPKSETLQRLGETQARHQSRGLCKDSAENLTRNGMFYGLKISTIVQEHATLSAGASVDHGVDVETTKDHLNRAADRGCCVSTCSISSLLVEEVES